MDHHRFLAPILSRSATLSLQARYPGVFERLPPSKIDLQGVDEGFCYLDLIRPEYHAKARKLLDICPSRAALEHLSEINDWLHDTTVTFTMKVSRPPGFPKLHYLLHVQRVNQGISALTAAEIIQTAPPFSLFGLDPAQATAAAATLPAVSQPFTPASQMYVNAGSYPTNPTLKFVAEFKPRSKLTFSPTANASLRAMLLLFESARIQKVQIDFFLDTGKNYRLDLAVDTSSTAPPTYFSAPVHTRVGGSDLGPVERSWTMPEAGFGTEIRATPLGNPPPHFHFYMHGGSGSDIVAYARIYMTISLAGSGVIPPINITTHQIPVPETQAMHHAISGDMKFIDTN